MAIITYPLNGIEYTAEDAELYHATRTSGVFANDDFPITVSGDGNIVTIGDGIGWIRNTKFSGKVVANDGEMTLDLGLPHATYPRIDAVVLQFSANANGSNIIVKNGTAMTDPTPPEVVRTESVYELHLYHVYRPAGATSIVVSNVTDLRLDETYCGLMRDGVTGIPTSQLQMQANALLEQLRTTIENAGSLMGAKSVNGIKPDGTTGNVTLAAGDVGAMPITGGGFTGPVNMNGNTLIGLNTPTSDSEAATKSYADSKLPISGGTMTGNINMGGNYLTGLAEPFGDTDAVRKAYADSKFLAKTGGTMTGNISMGGNVLTGLPEPYADTDAVRKAYADGKIGKTEFFHGALNGDLNNCTVPGWYWLNLSTCANAPLSNGYGFMEVISEVFSNGGVIQRFTIFDNGCTCVRGSVNGWSTWKWTNPPMAAGVEYLTAERWNGNDVFCRLVDCGVFADGKSITVDIGTSVCHCLYYCGYIGGFALPHIYEKNLSSISTGYIRVQSNASNGFAISMDGGSYMNQATYVLLKYIKS